MIFMEKKEKTFLIDSETSKRITTLRFILAVLVVFVHNNFTAETVAAGGADILFNQNAFGSWVQLFISGGIARCAVPLFFLFAAYLQAKKNDSYGVLLRKKARSLLVPFFLWAVVYFIYPDGIKFILSKCAPYLLKNPDKTFLNWSVSKWLHNFFGYSLAKGAGKQPEFAGQFWFVRDLIILTVLSPAIQFCIKRFREDFLRLRAFYSLFL